MAQFARPTSDISLGGWSGPAWSTLDEAVASDADLTTSPVAPASATLEVKLGIVEDPLSSTGHVIRYRLGKSATGGAQINMDISLVQGTTVIATWSHSNVDALTTYSQTLTALQADAITDYSDLRLRFSATQV